MKTYVFIIRRICNITGAQQYVYNKMQYLESQGWRVLIFSSMKGEILIDGFKKFEHLILPSLYLSPVCYRKSEVERTISRITDEIGDYDPDNTIIESDASQRAVWAEIIASRLKCRHLCMLVQEKYKRTAPDSLTRFKYDRHELSCITKDGVRMLFGVKVEEVRPDAYFVAKSTNVVREAPDRYSEMLDANADFSFGSLGRLGKPYVAHVVDAFRRYALSHPDKRFNVVFIGDSTEAGKKDQIRKQFEELPNVHLVMTGNVYPVPRSFAQKIDVFVSTAGASGATYNAGFPTVKVHPLTGEPIGVIGLDYMPGEKSMYESMQGGSVEDCIDKALTQKSQIRFTNDAKAYEEKMKEEFERQLTFINYTDKKEYYPEKKLMKIPTPSHYPHSMLWIIGHFFGIKGQTMLWKLQRS